MTRTPNPFHAVYDAMPEDEKIYHIRQHPALAESCVEIFEGRSGYKVQLIPESTWGPSLLYTARIHCIKHKFSVDRTLTVKDQMTTMELGLNALQRAYEHWQLKHELHKILELHGVTDARKV